MIKFAVLALLLFVGASASAREAGKPRREYRGKTYVYEPYYYQGPVWYAGNGYIAKRPTGYVNYYYPVWQYQSN